VGGVIDVEICHIKGIAEFSQNSLISEVNALSNLVALCKNHHWEHHHGYLRDIG
jgi:predicted HNH restriction endonuclease